MKTYTVTLSDQDEAVLAWLTAQQNAQITAQNATMPAGSTPRPAVTEDDVFNAQAQAAVAANRQSYLDYRNAQRVAALATADPTVVAQVDTLLGTTT